MGQHFDVREGTRSRTEAVAAIERAGYWPVTRMDLAGTFVDTHWHPVNELVYLLQGELTFEHPDGERACLAAGQQLVLRARTAHRVTTPADALYIVGMERIVPEDELFRVGVPS